ncbi:hypothetical protein C8R46DRAFT_1214853 [Mycena filopes]|nr:hypothetical protein C8R46DRAFT_1214848 [Mycena filopes]KAJ7174660.1 hypothetical protein C8R46DRAFT_1214853 [Mycena filopes]
MRSKSQFSLKHFCRRQANPPLDSQGSVPGCVTLELTALRARQRRLDDVSPSGEQVLREKPAERQNPPPMLFTAALPRLAAKILLPCGLVSFPSTHKSRTDPCSDASNNTSRYIANLFPVTTGFPTI